MRGLLMQEAVDPINAMWAPMEPLRSVIAQVSGV